MSEVTWQIGVPTGNHLATYRGIRIVIKRDERGRPREIGWFICGRVAERMLVDRDLESAKKIGLDVIDLRIPMDALWARAERRDRESELWNNRWGLPHLPEAHKPL